MLTNRFSGICKTCGKPVAKFEGKVMKNHGAWEVYCIKCAIETERDKQSASAAEMRRIQSMWWNK